MLRFREALEGVTLAAERDAGRDAGIRAANAKLLKVQKQGNQQAILDANQQFHFMLYACARNALLQTMIETLWMRIGPHLGLLLRNNAGDSVAANRPSGAPRADRRSGGFDRRVPSVLAQERGRRLDARGDASFARR